MKYRSGLLALLFSVVVAAPAFAQDEGDGSAPAGHSPIQGKPYYVSPMFSYTLADKARGTKDGYGGVISVGKKMTEGLNLELTTFYSTLKGDDKATAGGYSGNLKFKGAGLTAMLFPLSSWPNAYGVVSLAYGTAQNQPYGVPQYSATPTSVSSFDYQTTVFDTGIGYLWPITSKFLLRTEARYRMDSHGREFAGIHDGQKSAFYEGVFNVGLLMPLGTIESAAGATEPAEAAPTAAADSDNDGVTDDKDKCPGTPAGAIVDENGCERDSDGDGVVDRLDKCPDTPAGTPVNADGCPLDSDGDGVPDDQDECPNTPAGAKVLANGCALKDDCRKPHAGESVDENGCAVDKAFILRGVNFEFDSERLTPEAKEILNQVAETLKSYADLKVEIAGHTDDVGTEAYNMGLSERRANSVKVYLASRGVDGERLSSVGYGKTQPIDPDTTDEARAKNRRVELRVQE